jgi:alkylation response protein AidB-like acyl-CoA dehydrogenase
MDLTLSPAEEAFRDELREWLAANNPGREPAGDEAAFEFRLAWQRKLHDAGWAGVSWPKEYGGRGATLVEQAIFNEEVVRARTPSVANVLALAMGGPTVIAHGTEEQRQRYLPPILSGDEIWCQGFSEPESGSDLASLKTRAVRHGDEWVVTGQKVWTTFAHHAKWCMLVARTDPDAPKHKGLTYFLMDMEQEEVQVRPLVQITGEAEFNEVFLDDVFVPEDQLVGALGQGWAVASTTLAHERGTNFPFKEEVVHEGYLSRLFATAAANGTFDDPAVADGLVDAYVSLVILRTHNWRTLSHLGRGGEPGPESSWVKLTWSDMTQQMSQTALAVMGTEAPLMGPWQRQWLWSKSASVAGGTSEVQRNVIGERILGLPREQRR